MTGDPDLTQPRRYKRAGDYDLIRKMGSGGFGTVFEARHRETGLLFAIKRIGLSEDDAERFRKEALYPARIAGQSMHVLGVQSFFYDADADAFYLVTELIPHGDLRTFLNHQTEPLPLVLGLELAIGIAKGLGAIHGQGIVHRDLKPANVLMDRKDDRWVPKIADFGLARSTGTVTIGDFASSGYAAPEQMDRLSDRPPGPESDMFAFGMILYELLTGHKPTTAQDLWEYARWTALTQPPAAPSTVREELRSWPAVDTLIASLLTFDRTLRTTTASEAVRALAQVLQQVERGIELPPPAPETQQHDAGARQGQHVVTDAVNGEQPSPDRSWVPWPMVTLAAVLTIAVITWILGNSAEVDTPPADSTDISTPATSQPPRANPSASNVVSAGSSSRTPDGARVASLTALIAREPRNAAAHVQLGDLYFDVEDFKTASLWYERSLEINPNDADASTDLGVCYYYLVQHNRAIQQLTRSLAIDPGHTKAILNRGIVYAFGKQDFQAAAADWRHVVAIAPNSPEGQAARRALEGLSSK